MPVNTLNSIASLRKLISEPPAMMKKRLQRVIDEHCLTIIEKASVCAVGFMHPALDIVFLNTRDTPVLRAQGKHIRLSWPADKHVPHALKNATSLPCSLYFIMPGIGFALRANGHASLQQCADGRYLEFEAVALFVHCSRAKVRAKFWQAHASSPEFGESEGQGRLPEQALTFIALSPYLLMLTDNLSGATELSPRGDPPGFVMVKDEQTLLIPERPGNKVACTLSNILSNGSVKAVFLIPGCQTVLAVSGTATLSADQALLRPLAINGKVPVVATVLQVQHYRLVHCPELLAAGLWQPETYLKEADLPAFSKMLSEHMNGKGLLGKVTTTLVDAVVKHDLRNLY